MFVSQKRRLARVSPALSINSMGGLSTRLPSLLLVALGKAATLRRFSDAQSASTLTPYPSRGVEGPGPVTLRQPTFGHGGNARFDEEVTVMEFVEHDRVDARNRPSCGARGILPFSQMRPNKEPIMKCSECGDGFVATGMTWLGIGRPPLDEEKLEAWAGEVIDAWLGKEEAEGA